MNRKVKSFKQTVFLLEQCAVSKLTTTKYCTVFRPWHRPTIVQPLACCPVDDTLFEVSPEIRSCRCAKSLLLLWKPCNIAAGSIKPI